MIRSFPLLLFVTASLSGQAVTNSGQPTSTPNQINITTSYLYLNKVHYAGTWSSSVTYNSQDLVFYSSGSYISLTVANLNHNPATATLNWVAVPGGGAGTWGSITGTLTDQTDLVSALAAKQATITAGTTSQYWRGDKTFVTLPTFAANTTATSHQYFTAFNSTTGAFTKAQPACADISDASTGCTATLPAFPSGTIVGSSDTQVLTNKTIDGVTSTTMGYLDATSSIQTQLNAKQASLGFTAENSANKDAASGYAGLTAGSLLKAAEFPALTGECTTASGAIAVTCGAAIGRVANPLSQFAATTSAQLASVLSDENGTGPALFGTAQASVFCPLNTCGLDSTFVTVTPLSGTNQTWFIKVNVPAPGVTVNHVQLFASAGGNTGHMAVAFYDSTCTKVADSASITGGGTQVGLDFTFSALALAAGTYYLEYSNDSASGAFFRALVDTAYTGYFMNLGEAAGTYNLFKGSNSSTTVSTTTTGPATCGTRTALQAQGTGYIPGIFIH